MKTYKIQKYDSKNTSYTAARGCTLKGAREIAIRQSSGEYGYPKAMIELDTFEYNGFFEDYENGQLTSYSTVGHAKELRKAYQFLGLE